MTGQLKNSKRALSISKQNIQTIHDYAGDKSAELLYDLAIGFRK